MEFRDGSRGGCTRSAPPLKLEKIWFFGIKSWFFTRNTPTIFAPPSARHNFFYMHPPLTWNPRSAPGIIFSLCFIISRIKLGGHLSSLPSKFPNLVCSNVELLHLALHFTHAAFLFYWYHISVWSIIDIISLKERGVICQNLKYIWRHIVWS